MIRVALYLRLSRENDASMSLAMQEERLRTMCAASEYEVAEIYSDEGESGATLVRPALQRMLEDMKAKPRPFDLVAIFKFDRISRSLSDFLKLVEHFERRKVGLLSYTERLDTNTPHGKFAVQVLVGAAELERALIASRTSAALQFRKSKMLPYGPVPFGLDRRGGALEPNGRELETVRRIYFLRNAERRSLQQIADALAEANVTTKLGKRRWSKEQIRAVLSRPALYASLLQGLAVHGGG